MGHGEPATPFLFTGREYDAVTGLYHYRTRAYSPDLGRFLQPDSIDFGGGDVNLYRYVLNNPANYRDPEGTFSPMIGIAAVLGAVAAIKILQHRMCEEFAMNASSGANSDAEKHCLVSCNYARCVGMGLGLLGSAQAIALGVGQEIDQFRTVGNSWVRAIADIRSNLIGIINGLNPFRSCEDACKECKGKWNP